MQHVNARCQHNMYQKWNIKCSRFYIILWCTLPIFSYYLSNTINLRQNGLVSSNDYFRRVFRTWRYLCSEPCIIPTHCVHGPMQFLVYCGKKGGVEHVFVIVVNTAISSKWLFECFQTAADFHAMLRTH